MINLRPNKLEDMIGQQEIIERLKITVAAAKHKQENLAHILLNGPPGLGKTTLAGAIADAMGVKIRIANGGNLSTIKDILPYLIKMIPGSILFIDEIHRMPSTVEEMLYPVMEDFRLDIGGDEATSIPIPEFTLIGATTIGGMLSKPLYDRFIYNYNMKLYDVPSICQLLSINAVKIGLTLDNSALQSLAARCRGTPRIANHFLMWLGDYSVWKDQTFFTYKMLDEAMLMLGVDSEGMTKEDHVYLAALRKSNAPVGLATLSSMTNIDSCTITDVIEPYLIFKGLIVKTPMGRRLA